ncbi:HNH endonuclease [Providencia manganoxydans]
MNIGFNEKNARLYSKQRDIKFNIKFKVDNLILFEKYINMPDDFSFSRYLIIKNKEKTDYYREHINKLLSDEVKLNLPYGISNSDVGETERDAIIKQRTKQKLFRDRLFSMWGACCAVTNIDINELIIASHIKPWSECNNDERIDAANGIPLCSHFDKLFDKHLITFF